MRGIQLQKKRRIEKIELKKKIRQQSEKEIKSSDNTDNQIAKPAFLLDRQTENRAKILSNSIKEKKKTRAGVWDVPINKVDPLSDSQVFKVLRSGKRKNKEWKRKITMATLQERGFTRKSPKYERFIKPSALRYRFANVTHPELKCTYQLEIIGVKKNPSSQLYTDLNVITKGTIIEVRVDDLGLITQSGKIVWGKYAQVTNKPEVDGCINALLIFLKIDVTLEKQSNKQKVSFKIVVLGSASVGKTSIINKFASNQQITSYKPTLGCDLINKQVEVGDKVANIIIWDIQGQLEQQHNLGTLYFRNADACFLVFDITTIDTLNDLKIWKEKFMEVIDLTLSQNKDYPIYVLANKIDKQESINQEDIKQVLSDIGIESDHYFETSAKTGQNISEAFTECSKILMERNARIQADQQEDEENFQIDQEVEQIQHQNTCCM